MPDRSRRIRLRETTSEAHASLDRLVGSFDSRQSYGVYLRGISAFRAAMERKLSSVVWPSGLAVWPLELFSDLIAADLEDLDIPAQPAISPPDLPAQADEMLGMIYVLEGSALGARLLYKRAQLLGFDADFGARHLALQSRRSDRWSDFLALLESADAVDMDRVASASCATFLTAETAFRRVSHEPA